MPTEVLRSRPVRLSAAIITRNEEKNLADCLQSLSFADEIVIVDSGSTDATAEIAGRFPARFLSRPFDHFSAQKNEAIRQTSGEWVLLIDADERISPELADEITRVVQRGECDGYWIKRHNYFFGKRMRFSVHHKDLQMRLIRRGKGWFEGVVHERIQLQGVSGTLSAPMRHYSTSTLEDYFRRFELYITLDAEKIYQKGIQPTALHIALKPLLEFLYFYFLRLGFLDGWVGLQYQILSSFYTSVKYMKARERFEKDSQPVREKITI